MADRPPDRRTGAVGARAIDNPDRGRVAELHLDAWYPTDALVTDDDLEHGTCTRCRAATLVLDVDDDGTPAKWCRRCLLADAQ